MVFSGEHAYDLININTTRDMPVPLLIIDDDSSYLALMWME